MPPLGRGGSELSKAMTVIGECNGMIIYYHLI